MINKIATTLPATIAALNVITEADAPVAPLGSPGCICSVTPYPPVSGNQGRIGVLAAECPAKGHGHKEERDGNES